LLSCAAFVCPRRQKTRTGGMEDATVNLPSAMGLWRDP
jgi:hypothetical protein